MRLSILMLVLLAGMAPTASAAGYCSNAGSADQVVYTIGSWEGLRIFYDKFGGCDDGNVSLELSDRVSDMLANHWDTLDKLKFRADADGRFSQFVFLHIDPTVMPDRYPKILDNAKNHCPDGDQDICARIAAAAAAPPQQ